MFSCFVNNSFPKNRLEYLIDFIKTFAKYNTNIVRCLLFVFAKASLDKYPLINTVPRAVKYVHQKHDHIMLRLSEFIIKSFTNPSTIMPFRNAKNSRSD